MNKVLVLVISVLALTTALVLFLVRIFQKKEEEGKEHLSWKEKRRRNVQEEIRRKVAEAGQKGEESVACLCEEICREYGGALFNDFCFEDENGYSSEIDHILITRGGIFVIETKNWNGTISGNPSDEFITFMHADGKHVKRYRNPILQNESHIRHLKRRLYPSTQERISMVIFVKGNIERESQQLFNLYSARWFLAKKANEARYPSSFVHEWQEKLSNLQRTYGIDHRRHRQDIEIHQQDQ